MKTLPDDASPDQTGNIPTGYYRRNTGMLHILPADTNPQSPALSDEQLQDKSFLRSLAMKELVAIVQANKGDIRGVNACNALLDRVEGKAVQVINQHVTVVEEMSDLELAKAILFYTRPALLNKEKPILDVTPMPVVIDN